MSLSYHRPLLCYMWPCWETLILPDARVHSWTGWTGSSSLPSACQQFLQRYQNETCQVVSKAGLGAFYLYICLCCFPQRLALCCFLPWFTDSKPGTMIKVLLEQNCLTEKSLYLSKKHGVKEHCSHFFRVKGEFVLYFWKFLSYY